jgi:hypothetical protein
MCRLRREANSAVCTAQDGHKNKKGAVSKVRRPFSFVDILLRDEFFTEKRKS